MKLLLDTHVFIWSDDAPERLPAAWLAALQDPANELVLSAASVWEMQVKTQIGKMTLSLPLRDLLEEYQRANSLRIIPIEVAHVLALNNLPLHHKDPFDRLIIAQAIVEDMTIVSADTKFPAYSVRLLT